jgi:hypothetical protein
MQSGAKFQSRIAHRFNDIARTVVESDLSTWLTLFSGAENRANGAMALHFLEVMEGVLTSAAEHRFFDFEGGCKRPAPLSVNFPDDECEC